LSIIFHSFLKNLYQKFALKCQFLIILFIIYFFLKGNKLLFILSILHTGLMPTELFKIKKYREKGTNIADGLKRQMSSNSLILFPFTFLVKLRFNLP